MLELYRDTTGERSVQAWSEAAILDPQVLASVWGLPGFATYHARP